MANCKQCGQDYEAKRSTSVYCSPKCKQEFYRNRMSKPVTVSDAKPVTVTSESGCHDGFEIITSSDKPKRGKDIKCFNDLPEDVRLTILKMSRDKEDYEKRVVAAIRYQHLFPDRYENQSTVLLGVVVTGKPGDVDYNGICTPEWRAERGR